MKKVLVVILIAVLLLGIGIPAKLFLIGDPVDGNTVVCEVTEDDNQVNLHVTTTASAIAFTDSRLHQEGDVLHITMRKVLVSPLYSSGSRHIWIGKGGFSEILLGGIPVWKE